jgi:hypothetical protein
MPIAHIPCRIALVSMFQVAQVIVQFHFQASFNHGFVSSLRDPLLPRIGEVRLKCLTTP